MRMRFYTVLFIICVSCVFSSAGKAKDIVLGMPLVCKIGESCWIMNYPDVDSGETLSGHDFNCYERTYKQHTGTDFAISDMRTMRLGVPVIATAPGVVVGVRDGEPDGAFLQSKASIQKGKACGNGVRIRHADGWETQTCHMRIHSISVKVGQSVVPGTQLGLLGLSGRTEFPHVHLTVRQNGDEIDPFTGVQLGTGCGVQSKGLWKDASVQHYTETAVYASGFADRVLKSKDIKADVTSLKYRPRPDTNLVGWAAVFGMKPGLTLHMTLRGPDQSILASHVKTVTSPKAWMFVALGRRVPAAGWPPGRYHLQTSVQRDGEILSQRQMDMTFKASLTQP